MSLSLSRTHIHVYTQTHLSPALIYLRLLSPLLAAPLLLQVARSLFDAPLVAGCRGGGSGLERLTVEAMSFFLLPRTRTPRWAVLRASLCFARLSILPLSPLGYKSESQGGGGGGGRSGDSDAEVGGMGPGGWQNRQWSEASRAARRSLSPQPHITMISRRNTKRKLENTKRLSDVVCVSKMAVGRRLLLFLLCVISLRLSFLILEAYQLDGFDLVFGGGISFLYLPW
jgi:hypothetical protein